ncbi:putative inorganic carbon transporter subunit DabA, partial [Staphylococcus epidermidis]|uniref:putative inorganic carbon transporter subunit DabA n=1 Tax=Staphylococcus epidermidis TaxID=1282 RepID=UPI00119F3982
WLAGWEERDERGLVDEIYGVGRENSDEGKGKVQVGFCIDVGWEGFRRDLESEGGFERIGIGGLFGVGIEKEVVDEEFGDGCLGVMVEPGYGIKEYGDEDEMKIYNQQQDT